MRKLKLVIWGGIAAALMASSAGAFAKTLMTCETKFTSREGGGGLHIITFDPDPKATLPVPLLQVYWKPPQSGSTMEFIVSYGKASLNAFGATDGAYVKFAPGIGSRAAQFQAIVSTGGAELGRFQVGPDLGPGQGIFMFSADDPAGKAVLDAVNAGKRVDIAILKDGVKVASETFDTTATPARAQLLDYSRQLIETADPRVCKSEQDSTGSQ